jgi:UrcA family protein
MKISIASAVMAMAMCLAATAGSEAGVISQGGPPKNQFLSDAPLTTVVHFSDLDGSSVEGAKRLYARLRRAASEVCESLESASAEGASEHRACVTEAIDHAVADINRPLLSEYHRSHAKGRVRNAATGGGKPWIGTYAGPTR